ncbi:Retrovirus-related Pol polyprotein from transposon TNT 1-94 [Dendrobium catenatum]|uniref:Retrovirus-related Pol polyprotein from transposon TNT 1-94 n=1 Tax=Dendrobium catenatum TaxID=906689 RepID=A0A2I0VY30_9ASPA|nr:Retrovirus-related Pol polyprotein from transposon TNT 1-94 [Dendrobium catenatum]
MKNLSMSQYLTEIKKIVDLIASAGSTVDSEDVMIYILNGLPPSYQPFAASIRTMQTSLTLDNLYALLISEEIHLQAAATKFSTNVDTQTALYASNYRGRRGRSRPSQEKIQTTRSAPSSGVICQICKKKGHSAEACWHRLNPNYIPSQPSNKNSQALLANNDTHNSTDWYLDSGASTHMTNSTDNLATSNVYTGTNKVTLGDGRSVPIAHSGMGLLPTPSRKLFLSQLLHTPSISHNLLSVSNLVKDNNISIIFDSSGFIFKDLTTNRILLRGPCRDGLYRIAKPVHQTQHTGLSVARMSSSQWHNRLGHPSLSILQHISKNNPDLHISSTSISCTPCNQCKGHKLQFPISENRKQAPLELLHSDVWGPSPVPSHQGFRYYVIFVDDYSRFIWLFPIMFKSDVTNIFINFVTFIERQTSRKIKAIRTDGGGEYVNQYFQKFTRDKGILHQTSCPYTPEQNGLAERKHRHIMETTRTLLETAQLPSTFWLEAATTATYIINRTPSITTHFTSPLKLMFNITPSYNHFRTFGCACFPLKPPHARDKLTHTSDFCIFLGYSEHQKGYKCFNPKTNRITISRHVQFDETVFPFPQFTSTTSSVDTIDNPSLLIPVSTLPISTPTTASMPVPNQTSSVATTVYQSVNSTDITTTSNSQVSPNQAVATHPMVTRRQTGNLKPTRRLNLLHQTQEPNSFPAAEPTTYKEAYKSAHWREAMAHEFFALQKQGTWQLVPPPQNEPILGSKWTYRTKLNSDGSIARYKARLVAQGNRQEHGLDYNDTFSPVAKLPTIRILFTLALFHHWPVQQLDVTNAFLHGELSETVYMRQPKGFEDASQPEHVCLLRKAIYGLKQASRQWYTTFTNYLLILGFKHSQADQSLLTLHHGKTQVYLLVYVDDILLTGNDQQAISTLLQKLHSKFTMKNLGLAHHFLGIKITSSEDKYHLSQSSYALSILHLANLTHCNHLANPSCTKLPSQAEDEQPCFDHATYRRIIGSFQYLTLTRPDIAFAVNTLSQHMHDPEIVHTYLLKRLLRYIKGTIDLGIPITRSTLLLRTFSDADWAADPISRKSISGFCTYLGDTLVSWTVKKQSTVSRSSTESEYRALAAATADTIWIKKLLSDFSIMHSTPIDIFCDNISTIALANNPVFHARTKHIEIDQRFVRDHIQINNIRLLPINTIDQIADIFTKPLTTNRFQTLRSKLTVAPQPSVCGAMLE